MTNSPTVGSGAADEPILLNERDGHLAILTLNRPDRLNALSRELHEALTEALREAAHDPDVRAVVLTGAGRGFCSGGDLGGGGREHMTQEARIDRLLHHAEANLLLHEMPKPTVALINGAAAGAGLALALACDIRIAADDMIMTTAYAKVGLSGDHGVTFLLNALVGPSRAAELMFLSERVEAARALELGLVNRVVPAPSLRTDGLELARALAAAPPVAIRHMKRNIRAAGSESLRDNMEREAASMVRCSRTEDAKEAALSRREKRAAVFLGR
jgi:2-(1,2-epoxy-1,2-dihydrophenyl)acetyl-CoA isomerase